MMRFDQGAHRFYCGVDLHARSTYVCIVDHAGKVVLHEDLPAEPEAFLQAIFSGSGTQLLSLPDQRL